MRVQGVDSFSQLQPNPTMIVVDLEDFARIQRPVAQIIKHPADDVLNTRVPRWVVNSSERQNNLFLAHLSLLGWLGWCGLKAEQRGFFEPFF